MEMAYRERWQAEIAELQRILSGFDFKCFSERDMSDTFRL